jgi:hypothetical protein
MEKNEVNSWLSSFLDKVENSDVSMDTSKEIFE